MFIAVGWHSYQPCGAKPIKEVCDWLLIKWRSHNEHRYQQYQKKVSDKGFVGKA
jgi:hypothetical protein